MPGKKNDPALLWLNNNSRGANAKIWLGACVILWMWVKQGSKVASNENFDTKNFTR